MHMHGISRARKRCLAGECERDTTCKRRRDHFMSLTPSRSSVCAFDDEQERAARPRVMQTAQLRVGPADRIALQLVHARRKDGDLRETAAA